jgi:MFS family permease
MKTIIRNTLAVIVGFLVGSVVNMALVNIGMSVVPLPEGADVATMDGLRESMKLFTPLNFLFPWLAHALGTLVGAFLAAKLAASHHRKLAIGIGVLFLLGGITMIVLCGGPLWFIAADLLLAYIPMGYLGGVLAGGKKSSTAKP